MDRPCTLDQLKIDALKCDNRYWERQHEKAPIPTTRTKTGSSSAAPTSASPQSKTPPFRASIGEKPPKNVSTMPNLQRPQDEPHLPFLENRPLTPPLRRSLETLLHLWETNQ